MITLNLDNVMALQLAQSAICEIREYTALIRLMSQPHTLRSSPAARASSIRIAQRKAASYRPLLKTVVGIYGATLFRRNGGKPISGLIHNSPVDREGRSVAGPGMIGGTSTVCAARAGVEVNRTRDFAK